MLEENDVSLPPTVFKNGSKGRTWSLEALTLRSGENYAIPLGDVIAVRYVCKRSGDDPKNFEVIYAKRGRRNVWCTYAIKFAHEDVDQVILWVQTIRNLLDRMADRPRKVIMFVNPFGGKKKGVHIYQNYAKPLFEMAGVELNVVVTKRKNEIRDTLMEVNDLDDVDAVISVGGDGTVGEIFTGLVLRECRLRGIDPNDPNVNLPRPKTKVGVIPCGSTNTTNFCLHGTTDVVTAILHVIMGFSLGLDLVSVHHDNELLQVCSNAISYGFLGDVVYHSEKLRWMGPSRYEYVGAKKMILNDGYKGTVSILGDEIDENETKCCQNCSRCSSNENSTNKADKWIAISSNFFVVAGANMTCAGSRNPHGLAPYCHLGDGYLNVLIVHHTSLYKRLRTFQRFSQSTYSLADLPHVQTYRGKEFKFKVDDGRRGRWNCDGESILHTNISAKVHRQLITVFGRGIPKS